MSLQVNFYSINNVADEFIKFAVIMAKYNNKWVYCRHKERDTYEIPGGRREKGEKIIDTAFRELYEETGAIDFSLNEVCVYSVTIDDTTSYGMLYFADIKILGKLPEDMEMAEIIFCDTIPERLTYPNIQPILFEKVRNTFYD